MSYRRTRQQKERIEARRSEALALSWEPESPGTVPTKTRTQSAAASAGDRSASAASPAPSASVRRTAAPSGAAFSSMQAHWWQDLRQSVFVSLTLLAALLAYWFWV